MFSKRTIGMVTTSFPRWKGDHAGVFVLGMAKALARRGHRIEAVAPQDASGPRSSEALNPAEGVVVREFRYAFSPGAQRLFYGAGAPENLHGDLLARLLVPGAFASITAATAYKARRWDGVVSHWLIPSGLACSLAAKGSLPHLSVCHSGDVHLLERAPMGKLLARWVLKRSKTVGCISEDLAQRVEALVGTKKEGLGKKIQVTPMGVDLDSGAQGKSRRELRRSLGIKGFTILFLGRLVPIKGVDTLLEAVPEDARVVVAGDGPERKNLEARARRRGIKVEFKGWVAGEGKRELLSACDVLALPSRVLADGRREGVPTVLLEAMALGIPVVATHTGAVSELIKHEETGLLVPPDDPPCFANAIARLRMEPALSERLAGNARAQVEERSWDTLAGVYEKMLWS